MAGGTKRLADRIEWVAHYPGTTGGFMRAGRSSYPVKIQAAGGGSAVFHTTSAATTGTTVPFQWTHHQTVDQTSGGARVGLFKLEVDDIKLSWHCNAVKALVDFNDSGGCAGLGSAFCAEMEMADGGAAMTGNYDVVEMEMVVPTSTVLGAPAGTLISFLGARLSGGAASQFDTRGYLFNFQGYTAAAGKYVDENTIKIRMKTADKWLAYSDVTGSLSLGLTGSKRTHLTGIPSLAIWVNSTVTAGTQDIVKIDYTHATGGTSGYVKGIRCTMNCDVISPASFNAVKGIIAYGTSGYAHGDCAPLSSELTIPNAVVTRGAYYGIESQIAVGSSSTGFGSTGPYAFIKCGLTGTKAQWDLYGGLFNITGFTEGDGLFLDNAASPSEADGGIRFFINGAVRYLLYANDAD